jgi:2-polyprenyl-6-methoxyphenol hydroxylase-like FAD-dependent oxidoreductase
MTAPRTITIIGGGLAGLTLGIGLRQRGIPATIFESGRYPRHRVCGEFISGNGPAVLERLGLLPLLERAGAIRVQSARFISRADQSPVRTLSSPALGLSRYLLDATLANEFQRLGGELHQDSRHNFPASQDEAPATSSTAGTTSPSPIGWEKTGVRVSAEGKSSFGVRRSAFGVRRSAFGVRCSQVPGEATVRASGRRPQSTENGRRWFGLKAHARNVNLSADLEMHLSANNYVGVNRINDGEVNICGLFRARTGEKHESGFDLLRGKPGSPLHEKLADAEFNEHSFCSVAGLSLTPHRATDVAECCIGDAVTMIPPVTGNGMSMAFESAEIAIEPLCRYSRGEINWPEARDAIAQACDAAFAERLNWARRLQWLMSSPVLRTPLAKILLNSATVWNFMFAKTR